MSSLDSWHPINIKQLILVSQHTPSCIHYSIIKEGQTETNYQMFQEQLHLPHIFHSIADASAAVALNTSTASVNKINSSSMYFSSIFSCLFTSAVSCCILHPVNTHTVDTVHTVYIFVYSYTLRLMLYITHCASAHYSALYWLDAEVHFVVSVHSTLWHSDTKVKHSLI